MPGNLPTIYDVAKEAGVSIATVSRVLNTPHKVNPRTRSSVLEAIDRLGFVPKAESRDRARMSIGRIGVLIPFFTAPSFVQRLRGIASVLSRRDYELVVFPVDNRARMLSYLETLPLNRNIDGLIIVSQAFDQKVGTRLLENGLQTVVIEHFDPRFPTLLIDDVAGGRMAAQYLLKKGHHRLAFVGGSDLPEFGHDPIDGRMRGFCMALAEAGVDLPQESIFKIVKDPQAILTKLVKKGLPLAIFAATDLQAIVLLREMRNMGLKSPRDVAIIGFDDIDMAEYVGLTTIRQPLDESGRIATELLLSRLGNPDRSIQHIQLPLSIVERETA